MFKIKNQKKIYQKLYKQYGFSVEALHWRSKKTQEARFEALLKIEPKRGSIILDIGCGFGDFFGYLNRHLYFTKNVGAEITPEFARLAKKHYPEATIYQGNYLDMSNIEPDYIFASGVFAFGHQRFCKRVLKKALMECQKGLAFNLCKDPGFNQIDVKEMFDFLMPLSSSVSVVEGYLDNDITFLVRPQIALPAQSQSRSFPSLFSRQIPLTS